MKTLAVTGATGFVGRRLLQYNEGRYRLLTLSLRDEHPALLNLQGVDAIVHLAGKAHQMQLIDDRIYFAVNYELTKQLADRALEQGIKQFIYVSSTKVYGDDIPEKLHEKSLCRPTDAYGASKLQAEQYLLSLVSPAFTVAIVRPPLVYGPGVKGNMLRLMQLAAKPIPLPLGNTGNARSMVFVDNLVELLNSIVDQQAGGVFAGGDPHPLSTNELIRLMRDSLGNHSSLVSVPFFVRRMIQKYKPALYTRLFGSFVVDNSATNAQLHFTPPFTTAQGVAAMVNWFKENQLKKE
jgi:nucleoside-diphosphate-sugar epimerase